MLKHNRRFGVNSEKVFYNILADGSNLGHI
jgi:hypothetical protein